MGQLITFPPGGFLLYKVLILTGNGLETDCKVMTSTAIESSCSSALLLLREFHAGSIVYTHELINSYVNCRPEHSLR